MVPARSILRVGHGRWLEAQRFERGSWRKRNRFRSLYALRHKLAPTRYPPPDDDR
jgi:hypothetical protein